jgi:hypothetical protein
MGQRRILVTLLLFGMGGCGACPNNVGGKVPPPAGTQPAEAPPKAADVGRVCQLLTDCPDWEEIGPKDEAARKEILACMRKIAGYGVETIRAGMVAYVNIRKAKGSDAEFGKLMVLNSFLFDLPGDYKVDGPKIYSWFRRDQGGWSSPSDHVDLMWPLSYDGAGNVQLTGVFFAYSGGGYQAFYNFDHYYKTFGLRRLNAVGGPAK